MRLPLRVARLVAHTLAAVALATCSDSPTALKAPRAARVALAPVFSERALEAAAQLDQAGVAIASIRILIHRPGSDELLADKVVAVAPGAQSVTLELDLTIRGSEELLTAKLQYRDAGGVVLYEGVRNLAVRAGTNQPAEIPQTVIDYVGPGAGATTLVLTPADTTIRTTQSLTLAVTAKDRDGKVIPSPLVLWTSSDPELATVVAGVVTPLGPSGTVKVTARIPLGPSAEATVHLARPASQLRIAAPLADTVRSGSTMPTPLRVQLTDAEGQPVADEGVTVTVSAVRLGEAMAPVTVSGTTSRTTNGAGVAEFGDLTISGLEGAIALQVAATGFEPVRTEPILLMHGVVAGILVKPEPPANPVAAKVGEPIAARLWLETVDAAGNRVPEEPVRFVARSGGATGTIVLDSTIATNGIGELGADAFPVPPVAGTFHVEMSVGTPAIASAAITLAVAPTVPPAMSLVKISGDAQTDTIEAVLDASPLVVELRDGAGAPMANERIVWTAIPTIPSPEGESAYPNLWLLTDPVTQEVWGDSLETVTDAEGRARMYVQLGTSTSHPAIARASAPAQGLQTEFTFTIKPGAPDLVVVEQQPETIRAGLPFDPVLQVRIGDWYGNPVPLADARVTITPYRMGGVNDVRRAAQLREVTPQRSTARPTRRIRPASSRLAAPQTLAAPVPPGQLALFPSPTGAKAAAFEEAPMTVTGDTAYTDASGRATFTALTIGGTADDYVLILDVESLELWGGYTYVRLTPGLPAKLDVRRQDRFRELVAGDTVALEARLVDGWNNHIGSDAAERSVTWSTPAGTFMATGSTTATTSMMDGYAITSFIAPAAAESVTSVTVTTPGLGAEPDPLTGTIGLTVVASMPSAIAYGADDPIAAGDRQVRLPGETFTRPLVAKVLDSRGAPVSGKRVIWHRRVNFGSVVIDTTVTDAGGIVTLTPTVPQNDTSAGHVFEAVLDSLPHMSLRFQVATRPDRSYDRIWFGRPWGGTDGTSPWSDPDRWDGGVPTATSRVVVPEWSGYFTWPKLDGDATVAVYHGGAGALPLELAGYRLTVTGRIVSGIMSGAGTVRAEGRDETIHFSASEATIEIPQGASLAVDSYVMGRRFAIGGTLLVDDAALYAVDDDIVVGTGGVLELAGTGSIGMARHVIIEDRGTLQTGHGHAMFSGNFEQRGTTPLALDPAFRLIASYYDGTPRTIALPTGSTIGALTLFGPGDVRTPVSIAAPITIAGPLYGDAVVLTADSLVVDDVVQGTDQSSFAGVRTLLSRASVVAPLFAGEAPQLVTLDASTRLGGTAHFNDLEVRQELRLSGFPLTVNRNLAVIGREAGIYMERGADTVIVGGTAYFGGGSSGQYLAQGTLILRGDFMQADPAEQAGTFRPGPELEVRFAGKEPQNVTFRSPTDPTGPGSYFSRVRVESEANVVQKSDVFVSGRMDLRGRWMSDDYEGQQLRLLDVGSNALFTVPGFAQLSQLNLHQGTQVDINDVGSVSAQRCYDGGALIKNKAPECTNRSETPLLGGSAMGVK